MHISKVARGESDNNYIELVGMTEYSVADLLRRGREARLPDFSWFQIYIYRQPIKFKMGT